MSARATRRVGSFVEVLESRRLLTVVMGTNFRGQVFSDTLGAVPPDTNVAVGPAQVLELVNNNIAVYSKTGSLLAKASLYDAFAALSPGLILSDPQVAYDDQAGRFVVGVLDIDPFGGHFSLDVAVSRGPDLAQGFAEVRKISLDERVPITPELGQSFFADFPRLGWNADSIVFTFNEFAFPANTNGTPLPELNEEDARVDHVQFVSIDKSSVLDNNPSTFNVFHAYTHQGDGFYNLVPMVMHGAPAGAPMLFVQQVIHTPSPEGSHIPQTGEINLFASANLLSASPSFPGIGLPADPSELALDESTPPATQPVGGTIATNDARLLSAVYRDNHLVMAQTIGEDGNGPGPKVRWIDYDLTSYPEGFTVQSGTINPTNGSGTYFPAIEIAPNGDIGLTYMQSGPNEFMSVYFTGRKRTDPPNTMQSPRLVKAGESIYLSVLEQPPYRAGDFAGISIDPANGSFWIANEYATRRFNLGQAIANWGTWIANLVVTQPPIITPVSAPPPRTPTRTPARAPRLDVLEIQTDPRGLLA